MAQEQKPLSAYLKDKYQMAPGHAPGEYLHGRVKVDLSICTEAEADALIAAGCKVIIKLQKKADEPAADKKK